VVKLPFSIEQFLGVFQSYNQAVWPMQAVAYLLGLAAVVLALRKVRHSDRFIAGTLSFFWLWTGVMYHLVFFSRVNPAAKVFGILFVIQGLLFLWTGAVRGRISFAPRSAAHYWAGALFIIYSVVIYPLLGALQGHGYPQSPSFGITPCPVTIFTFGLLLWAAPSLPKHLLVIPLVWSLVGASAALGLGIREDLGLLAAGVIGTAMLVKSGRKKEMQSATG
jgi:hypothetical protein